MPWTHHPDELNGVSSAGISVILYEFFQAAYERIEGAMYFAEDLRNAKGSYPAIIDGIWQSVDVLESDYVEYYLPKYNEELVTSAVDFKDIPLQSSSILPIIEDIIDKLNSTPNMEIRWPNNIPIYINTTPDTVLDAQYWRCVSAYINSFYPTPSKTITNSNQSFSSQHTVVGSHNRYNFRTSSGQILSTGDGVVYNFVLDIDHIKSSESAHTSMRFNGWPLSFYVSGSTEFQDNWDEVQAAADAVGVGIQTSWDDGGTYENHGSATEWNYNFTIQNVMEPSRFSDFNGTIYSYGFDLGDNVGYLYFDEPQSWYYDQFTDPSGFAIENYSDFGLTPPISNLGDRGTWEDEGYAATGNATGFNRGTTVFDTENPTIDLFYYADLDKPAEEFVTYTY